MKKVTVYTDGGSRGNPGPSAAGVLILNDKDQVIKKYSHFLGDGLTNNQAEYEAVIFALRKLKLLFGKKKAKDMKVEVRTDSEFLVNQLKGKYKIIDSKIKPLFINVWNLKIDFKEVLFVHILREKNKEADSLVNQSLDERSKKQTLI